MRSSTAGQSSESYAVRRMASAATATAAAAGRFGLRSYYREIQLPVVVEVLLEKFAVGEEVEEREAVFLHRSRRV